MKWNPIHTAPTENSDGNKRLMVWIPGTQYQRARPAFARYNPDKHAARVPRPFWDIEGEQVSSSRARQPTHWAPEPEGP
jgi:hypothetical protein